MFLKPYVFCIRFLWHLVHPRCIPLYHCLITQEYVISPFECRVKRGHYDCLHSKKWVSNERRGTHSGKCGMFCDDITSVNFPLPLLYIVTGYSRISSFCLNCTAWLLWWLALLDINYACSTVFNIRRKDVNSKDNHMFYFNSMYVCIDS